MKKFNELYNKIIYEMTRWEKEEEGERRWEAYKESDEYMQKLNASKKYHATHHEEERLKCFEHYDPDKVKNLQEYLAEKFLTCITEWNKHYENIVLNKDIDLSINYSSPSSSGASKYTFSVTLKEYDHTGNYHDKIIETWTCKAGYPEADIVTKPYDYFTYKETEENITKYKIQNKKECFDFAKDIANYIKTNIKDLGKF